MVQLLDSSGRPFSRNGDAARLKRTGFALPQVTTFSGIVGGVSKSYRWAFDEALRQSPQNALAMRRDGTVRALLTERITPSAQSKWHLEPEDPKHPDQKEVTDHLTDIMAAIPRFSRFRQQLLQAVWFGRYGNQLAIGKRSIKGLARYCIYNHQPVHGDKFVFRWDGTPGVLISQLWSDKYQTGGTGMVGPTDPYVEQLKRKGAVVMPAEGRGLALFLESPQWRERFAIHMHEAEDADFTEPELAGGIHGVGLRNQAYYLWWLRQETLSWLIDYLARVGAGGLTLIGFEAGNDASLENARDIGQQLETGNVILVPKPVGSEKLTSTVDRVEPSQAGSQVLIEVVEKFFDAWLERLIVGQSMSSGADNESGLGGSGRANFASNCVPVDGSEILTRSGFKTAHSVEIGEEVLAYDVESDTCRWTPMLGKTFFENRPVSRLFSGKHKHFEAFCTEDHSWAVATKSKFMCMLKRPRTEEELTKGPRGGVKLKGQERLLRKANQIGNKDQLLLSAPEIETEESILTPTEAAVLGWALTDGHIRDMGTHYRVMICQSKEEHIPEIRGLSDSFNGKEWVGKPFTRTFPNGLTYDCKPQHWWRLSTVAANDMLKKCGYKSKADLPRIVTRLSSTARKAMLEAFLKAEGNKGRFFNNNPYLIEAFDILCALEGIATGSLCRTPTVWAKSSKKTRYVYGNRLELEPAGSADVWCPTTKYGTWVMRQNGRVMITGNTKFALVQMDCEALDECITEQVLQPLKRWNFPEANFKVKFVSDLTVPDQDKKLDAAKKVFDMGAELIEAEVMSAAGFTLPQPGDKTLSKAQSEPQMGGMPGAPPGPPEGGSPAIDDKEAAVLAKQSLADGSLFDPEGLKQIKAKLGGEQVKGGLADGQPDSGFDEQALAKGIEIEMEHTDDEEMAKEIAKDHLAEDPEYYDKLAAIEGKVVPKQFKKPGRPFQYGHAGKHAPKGYTKEHPLKIAGKEYQGGWFIPGDVLDSATDEELAQSEQEGPGAGGNSLHDVPTCQIISWMVNNGYTKQEIKQFFEKELESSWLSADDQWHAASEEALKAGEPNHTDEINEEVAGDIKKITGGWPEKKPKKQEQDEAAKKELSALAEEIKGKVTKTGLAKWLGKNGYSKEEAKQIFDVLGMKFSSEYDLVWNLSIGATGKTPVGKEMNVGKLPDLGGAEANYLSEIGKKQELKADGYTEEQIETLAAETPPEPEFTQADAYELVKKLGGSGDTAIYKDDQGKEWVLKKPRKDDNGPAHLANEIATDKLYRAAGLEAPISVLENGPAGLVKKLPVYEGKMLNDIDKGSEEYKAAVKKIQAGFAMDALLGNWDVIGLAYDNIMVRPDGSIMRLDNGGAMNFRAQGKKKGESWGDTVGELDTLRDKHKNPSAAAVFGGMKNAEIIKQINALQSNSQSILAAAPESERARLSARLQSMKKWASDKQGQAGAPKSNGSKIETVEAKYVAHDGKEHSIKVSTAFMKAAKKDYTGGITSAKAPVWTLGYAAKATKTIIDALKKYTTSSGADKMNGYLRSQETSYIGDAEKKQISHIFKAFSMAPVADEPADFHRTVGSLGQEKIAAIRDTFMAALGGEKHVTMSGFVSASTYVGRAKIKGYLTVTIKTRRGLQLEPITHHHGEDEILLNHGEKYRVISHEEVPGGSYHSAGSHFVLEQII